MLKAFRAPGGIPKNAIEKACHSSLRFKPPTQNGSEQKYCSPWKVLKSSEGVKSAPKPIHSSVIYFNTVFANENVLIRKSEDCLAIDVGQKGVKEYVSGTQQTLS